MKGRFKRFIRRVNRGVVLGLVLGVLLVGFVAADALKFKKDTEKIRENIVSYISDMVQLNATLNSSGIGKSISYEYRSAMRSGLDEIFAKYYADPALADKITVYSGYDSEGVAAALGDWFNRTAGFKLVSAEVDGESSDFRIKFERQGYRYAYVQLNDLPITMTLIEARSNGVDIFLGGGPSYLIDPIYPDTEEICGSENEKTVYVSGTMYLTLVDGEWRILMSDVYTKKQPELD